MHTNEVAMLKLKDESSTTLPTTGTGSRYVALGMYRGMPIYGSSFPVGPALPETEHNFNLTVNESVSMMFFFLSFPFFEARKVTDSCLLCSLLFRAYASTHPLELCSFAAFFSVLRFPFVERANPAIPAWTRTVRVLYQRNQTINHWQNCSKQSVGPGSECVCPWVFAACMDPVDIGDVL